VYLFTIPPNPANRVRYYLDGSLQRTDSSNPYDYIGGSTTAKPWDVTLAVGSHQMRVDVRSTNGSTTSYYTTFTVV
jgi:hypothetical protein